MMAHTVKSKKNSCRVTVTLPECIHQFVGHTQAILNQFKCPTNSLALNNPQIIQTGFEIECKETHPDDNHF